MKPIFLQIEQTIREFPNVRYLSLTKKIYNASQGYINGSIIFENHHRLYHFSLFLPSILIPSPLPLPPRCRGGGGEGN
ncbi:MAG: hypothetical protein EWV41_18015 [Microcystis wesenbergii Mw_MB_S_20031200_S109]|uniref:Uncharacterized protein n=1 Tax=Microcystis wesenbergii Mw_MB_S_20031200_S109D TaxID=2486241 RepID=A0A552LEX9_9CHRO|nr:MAG: hypothetical protein EWV41_18015 [Microcystis wesenbergii Mw_MB_S_20031200_S109]TRV18776.1 MAG: hypothetical protein EWV88_19710 [Microcystis wesenbergii Mw_MB_S_20031200_S109D]